MIGEEIKEKRIKNKITQRDLGEIIGCGRSNIALIETGRQYPSIPLLKKIASILDLDLNKIMDEEEKCKK